MKTSSIALVALALCLGLTVIDADAKRLGGGRNSGLQRDMPARTTPDAAPGKPATPPQGAAPAQQAAPTTPGAAPAAAATPPKRNWLGPLAGLAAGLGLAALFSHLGIGQGLGGLLLVLLLAGVAFFVLKKLLGRRQPEPAGMAYRAPAGGGAQVAWPSASPTSTSAPGAPASEPAAATPQTAQPAQAAVGAASTGAPARAFVPAAFDAEGFARTAKMIYIRLQAANDAGDMEDLRAFTTPEMFADLSLDVHERGAAKQHTEVLSIEPEVLDVSNEDTRQVVSVRFRGQVREAAGAEPSAVDEVWHLSKPHDGSRGWAVAGIEQWR